MGKFLDLTRIPSNKIEQIVEEAMSGCFDTFNRTMEQLGFATGMLPEEFLDKSARNVLLNKVALHNAFNELQVCNHGHDGLDYAWVNNLVSRMFDKFVEIAAKRELDLTENLTKKISAAQEAARQASEAATSVGDRLAEIQGRVEELAACENQLGTRVSDLESSLSSAQTATSEGNCSTTKRLNCMEQKLKCLSDDIMDIKLSIQLLTRQLTAQQPAKPGCNCKK